MRQVYDLKKFNLFNRDLKMEFATSLYEEATIPVLLFTFQKAAEIEEMLNKDIYEFNREEIDELFLNFNSKTKQSVASKISMIKAYLDFCIDKGLVPSMYNIISAFVGDEYYEKYINQTAVETQFINREELDDMINFCANAQDAVIIKLRYDGLSLKEISNLRMSDCKDNPIILRDDKDNITRRLKVEQSTLNLIEDAYSQQYYLKSNGEPDAKSVSSLTSVIKEGIYVVRPIIKSSFKKSTKQMLTQRMKRIFHLYDRPYLNSTNIWISGQIEMGKNILKESGRKELLKKDYETINFRYGYDKKYWNQTKRRIKNYVCTQ